MSDIRLPWKQGQKVIELGGGENPLIRPNVDSRWVKECDLVADLNYPIPLNSGEWDGVFCRFAVEHLSWRNVRTVLSEMYRLLKPGGIAVIITANLLEQARKLVETEEWNDDLICMVFGDQNYRDNYHKCGFSPAYIEKLLKEAGFYRVEVSPLQDCETDMMVFAYRSQAEIKTS